MLCYIIMFLSESIGSRKSIHVQNLLHQWISGAVHLLLPSWGDYFTPGILIATWVASSLLIHMQVGWAGDWGCLTAALLDESGILLLGCFGDPKN